MGKKKALAPDTQSEEDEELRAFYEELDALEGDFNLLSADLSDDDGFEGYSEDEPLTGICAGTHVCGSEVSERDRLRKYRQSQARDRAPYRVELPRCHEIFMKIETVKLEDFCLTERMVGALALIYRASAAEDMDYEKLLDDIVALIALETAVNFDHVASAFGWALDAAVLHRIIHEMLRACRNFGFEWYREHLAYELAQYVRGRRPEYYKGRADH